jgi:23S rRNA pseudouridine1911/1915/1917 synthase
VIPRTLVVPVESGGARLDRFLTERLSDLSRGLVQRLIEKGEVTVDARPSRSSERLRSGQVIQISLPPPEMTGIVATALPLEVVFESPDLVVLNKPAGLVVHPAPGHAADTLANALMARYPNLAVGHAQRPGIVHRLDKGTSGLLVVALTDRAFQQLVNQMQNRLVHKEYLALVAGRVKPDQGTIEAPIGRNRANRQKMDIVPEGREARTGFRVLERFASYSLLRLKLETGRTHQIRVHLAAIGHPIVGDAVYGSGAASLGLDRPFLHAWYLGFELLAGEACLVCWAPLPAELADVLSRLRAEL